LVKGVVNELKIKAKQKHLNVVIDVRAEKGEVIADEEKVRHVIYNFVDNAIKYTEEGKISVVIENQKEGISVRVRDSGVGFDEEDGLNFFQKFYRGKNVRAINVGGVGLGLYVARKFIEAHSGKIWAKSHGMGKGSEFGFWVPFVHKE
jgi:signal transduction histidine kinase